MCIYGQYSFMHIVVGRGGAAPPPQLIWGEGGNMTLPPPKPPTFSFNFYVKQEKKSQIYQVEG